MKIRPSLGVTFVQCAMLVIDLVSAVAAGSGVIRFQEPATGHRITRSD
jgi:hypothetical protein